MQPKNKNVRNELPSRYRRYCEFKRHLAERSSREVLPIGETNESVIKISKRGKHQQDIVYRTDGIMGTLAAGTHASTPHLTKIEQINNPKHSNDRVYGANGISPTLNTMQGGNRQPFIKNPLKGKTKYGWHFEQNVFDTTGISRAVKSSEGSGNKLKIIRSVLTPDRLNKRQNGRRMKNDGEPMFTLTGQDKHGVAIIDKKGNPKNKNHASTLTGGGHSGGNHSDMDLLKQGVRIRRLTPIECMRLQGFPDSWCDVGVVDTQFVLYKKCGNIEVCNQTKIHKIKDHDVRFKVVKENKKPISVIVSCITKDGKDTDIQKKELEQINTTVSVNIAIEISEKLGVWECVTNIIKCTDSIKTHYTLKKNVPYQVEKGIYEKQTELIPIEKLWKNILGENSLPVKLYTILTVINSITNCLIYSFVQDQNIGLCITLLPSLSKKEWIWEILSLKTKHIGKISDSSKYKMAGNAVTTNVVQAIIEKLLLNDLC